MSISLGILPRALPSSNAARFMDCEGRSSYSSTLDYVTNVTQSLASMYSKHVKVGNATVALSLFRFC